MNYNKLTKKELVSLLQKIELNSTQTLKGVKEEYQGYGFSKQELRAIELEHQEIIRMLGVK